MKKLVVLKLDGDLEVGVRVTLEIGFENARPSTEITAQLPSNPELVTAIDQWQSTYRSCGKSSRLEAKKIVYGGSITQWREDCDKSAVDLRSHLHNWLLSESFRPIREKWLQQLSPSDQVRVLIRTSSVSLRKLPWHLWDLIEDYPLAEVAYCVPESEQSALSKTPTYRDQVRILAILGNSTGINVQKDRQLLENLPDAVTTFLVEPQRRDINDQLWNQPWDILFFAGHSKTEGDRGRIFINQTDSLTIAQLKYALRNAVAGGLQLAIFNSCDGLGLARELEQLHIGQMIVMREPVPDQVAQTFLTDFIAAFATGKSFYLAEREAREKLHGLEDKFPCASWLPAIFQNPAAVPPMWQDLGRRPTEICPYRGLFAFREEDAPFFYGRDAFTQMLVEAVQQQQAAVEQPATMLGVTIESGLTERILDAVSAEPGNLPLLEFALNQLWAKQRDAQLTHAAYEEIGGVEAALSGYAEEAYGRLNEEEKERARRIFIQLVRPGEGTEDTRRLATRTEVGEENWDLVTRLADARLVVSSRDEAAGEETVEIVHEALIGGWFRLRQWIEVDRSFRTWQERLRASRRQWEASGEDEGALLRGAPLAEAEGWLQSRAVELSSAERVFIQVSLELRDRERKERERRRQRTIIGLTGGLGVVSILAVGAFWVWQEALTQLQQAEISQTNTQLNSLSGRSQALFNSGNRSEALIESIKAGLVLKWSTYEVKADTRTQVLATLQQVVYGLRELRTLKGYSGGNISFSPDGKTIAFASEDKTVKLWSEGHRLLRKANSDLSEDRSITIWRERNGNQEFSIESVDLGIRTRGAVRGPNGEWYSKLEDLKGHSGAVTSVSFSPDGKTIASASEDKTVKLWSIEGRELHTLKGHSGSVTSVSFSPDGKTIASASSDGTIILWNFDLEDLLVRGCDWLRDQKTNPNLTESGQGFCKRIGTHKKEQLNR